MSNYKKGDWCRIWDSLYWRFLIKHRERLSKKLSIRNLDRMDAKELNDHLVVAEKFLQSLEV